MKKHIRKLRVKQKKKNHPGQDGGIIMSYFIFRRTCEGQ